jgi:hypothetical protein
MPNKTISVPDDVVAIIDGLPIPFSRWVTEQLRRHAAQNTITFAEQLVADAAMDTSSAPSLKRSRETGRQMHRSAPW